MMTEGETKDCESCGTGITHRYNTWKGETKLQWQDEPGKAHFAWNKALGKAYCPNAEPKETSTEYALKRPIPVNNPVESTSDPTPEAFLELGMTMLLFESDEAGSIIIDRLTKETRARIAQELIKRSVIEKAMNDLGLQHPGRRGFIEDVLR